MAGLLSSWLVGCACGSDALTRVGTGTGIAALVSSRRREAVWQGGQERPPPGSEPGLRSSTGVGVAPARSGVSARAIPAAPGAACYRHRASPWSSERPRRQPDGATRHSAPLRGRLVAHGRNLARRARHASPRPLSIGLSRRDRCDATVTPVERAHQGRIDIWKRQCLEGPVASLLRVTQRGREQSAHDPVALAAPLLTGRVRTRTVGSPAGAGPALTIDVGRRGGGAHVSVRRGGAPLRRFRVHAGLGRASPSAVLPIRYPLSEPRRSDRSKCEIYGGKVEPAMGLEPATC